MSDSIDTLGAGTGSTTPDPQAPYTNTDSMANHILGAQMTAQEEGSKSLFDTATDIVTKGIPATGAAVFNSFYNTGVEVANFFGADAQKASIESEFGPDSETNAYYQEHAGVIEGTALAAGSLIPGLGAVKALKLAQMGKFGATMQTATGLFSTIRTEAINAAGVDLIGNVTGESVFGLNTVNKIKAVAAGVADQALQGAVYETATLATMHASPITDANTMADNISDVWDSMKGFGAIGGLIEGAGAIYKIRTAAKALDMATKGFEKFGATGIGNLTPGDKVVSLYQTLDAIPKPSTSLQQMKFNITSNTTSRLIQDQLIKVAGGDEELAGAFRKFIEKGRSEGVIGQEELTNNLSQLSKLGRHGDIGVESVPTDVFYVPKSLDLTKTPIEAISHDELMSKIANQDLNTSTSRAFALTNPTLLPNIGRASEQFFLPSITTPGQMMVLPKFAGAMDAYKQGVDIFVDSKGVTHINPNSGAFKEVPRPGESRMLSVKEREAYEKTGNLPVGSKPLNAVGLTLDVTNGKLFGEAPLPVVGDIGKPVLYNKGAGVQVGKTFFPHSAGEDFNPLSPNLSPLEANSRYVWAAMRGIKNGDIIGDTDLPMMEQAYRELSKGFELPEGLSFANGEEVPLDPKELLEHIALTKQSLYGDLLAQGKNADEIGHLLNSPTEGMTKNFNSVVPEELILPPEQSMNIKHVRLAYDIGTTKDNSGNLLRGLQATNYRMKLAADTNLTQVTNYLAQTIGKDDPSGKLVTQFLSALQFTKGAGDADILGAGSGFLSNANADYGTIAQQAERMYKATNDLITKRNSVVSDTLAASLNKLRQDPTAATEFANFRSVRQSTGESYILLNDADAKANNLPNGTVVLEGAMGIDPTTKQRVVNRGYLPQGFVDGSDTTTKGLKNYYTLSPKVLEAELASQSLNNSRNSLRSDWWKAQGLNKPAPNPERLYTPPLDTLNQPFMAYVREREGYALGESGAHVITAKSAEELQGKIASLGPNYDAFTKSDIANFKKAEGDFQFNRNFMNNKVGTELARKGILNNVVPETRIQNIIDDLANWHFKQEALLLRDHVELHNAATFEQLKAMGDRFDLTGTSRFGAITPFMQRSATNPYMSYVKTALGLSAKEDYPLYMLSQDKLEAFGDTAFNVARDALGATQKGVLPVEKAVEITKRMGLGNPYGESLEEIRKNYYGGLANQLPSPGLFRKFVATAGTILGATVIRLDTFQQLIHAVTLPIMLAMEHSSATADLQKLLTVKVPQAANQAGTALQVPGFTKTLFNMVKNYFNDTDGKLADLYHQTGMPRDELTLHRQIINQLTMPLGKLSESGWAQKIDGATQAAEKFTGTKFTNSFLHFGASDVGRQIGEAQGLKDQDLLDFIGTFSNRVLGNLSGGQRAGIFQGPVGQAVGLFQSYQWNMMQQLLRHIGEGDVKSLAMAAGMQSSIFGLSSLPGFNFLNKMIAERHGNTEGTDLYSATNSMLPHETADYLLHGSLSGLLGLSLYSRGDLNPRRASILPVNPLNFPTVSAGIRVYQTLAQLASNVTTQGGSVPASILLAAEHNGLSRPLTGLAELVQGFSTSPNGNLISRVPGLDDLTNISNMSRILGAKPLEEGIAVDAVYRQNALKVLDTARLQTLGSSLKTALYNNAPMAPEIADRFMADYVKAGGNQGNFNSWFLQQAKEANTSSVNRVMENYNSPRSRSLQQTMGGVPLPDYRNTGSTQSAPVAVPTE